MTFRRALTQRVRSVELIAGLLGAERDDLRRYVLALGRDGRRLEVGARDIRRWPDTEDASDKIPSSKAPEIESIRARYVAEAKAVRSWPM